VGRCPREITAHSRWRKRLLVLAIGSSFEGTDSERELLEKLLAKARGEFDGRIIAPFIVEFVDAGPISNADEDMAK
jgi:hypothetical protein